MLIHLDKAASQPLFEQLYTIIKSQILNGDRGADEKLPSKRQLQEDLSVSQTTIEHAYHLLVDEDLIYSKEKSGYYVSAIEQLKQVDASGAPDIERPRKKEYRLPLGTIDTSLVQSDALKQIAREIYSDAELLNKGEDSGESRLKAQIQKYLHLSRG
ncbi:GntR family transcriptional regulator [Salinicoccus sp. CNSTN-B1]